MKRTHKFFSGIALTAMTAMVMFTIGCSNSDNPAGPDNGASGSPRQTYDEITVSLDRLSVKYDCDYNPVGVTQPGEFRFNLNVDTLSDDASEWLAVTKHGEYKADVNNGGYKDVTTRKASFRLPRDNGQSFRVRLSLRELDSGNKNDFSSSRSITHVHSQAATQMYAPSGSNYSSWDGVRKVGSMSWNVNKRDRTWVAGILTKEGCNATLRYSVTVREVN